MAAAGASGVGGGVAALEPAEGDRFESQQE